jgi:hypothetical protein
MFSSGIPDTKESAQAEASRCGEPFERPRRRFHPPAFETRDDRLHRVLALG